MKKIKRIKIKREKDMEKNVIDIYVDYVLQTQTLF